MVVAEIQKDRLKQQKLHFIRAHQQAFDVEPIYPLRLFEDFVISVEGNCNLEASCKIKFDQLIASRFSISFQDKAQQWEKYLHQIITFFRQVENRVSVNLDYFLLKQFLGQNFDFSKVTVFNAGIDLRKHLGDSSVKIHIGIEDYPQKLDQALSLASNSGDLLAVRQFLSVVGFDFYFDGRTEIELYPGVQEEDFNKPETQNQVWKHFPSFVLEPLAVTSSFGFGFSKANKNPVLYYSLKDKRHFLNYFKINDTAQRVHSFYQHQNILPQMWVGTAQKELEKTRIDNIRLYYYQQFSLE